MLSLNTKLIVVSFYRTNDVNIKLIDGLHLNHEGVLCNALDEHVHLRQGDMDGACGPYCLAMAILILDKTQRANLGSWANPDYRTQIGKFWKSIKELDPLVLNGTTSVDLQKIIKAYNGVKSTRFEGAGKQICAEIRQSIDNGFPTIVDVRSRKEEGLNHWTLAIGYSDDFICLLDPGYELPTCALWNATLTSEPTANRMGYRYMNPWRSCDVEMREMVEIQP